MIRHLLKLVWRRKAANALLIAEMAISFLVLFAVCLGGLYYLANARHPLGFDGEGLWAVAITSAGESPGRPALDPTEGPDVTRAVLREARSLPQVASAALVQNAPYEMSVSRTRLTLGGRLVEAETVWASDELAETLRLDLVQGRWFEPSDEALPWQPVVVNRRLARELFGEADPLGGSLAEDGAKKDVRVIGVVSEFRRQGELSRPTNFMFYRQPSTSAGLLPLRNLLVRPQPGVTRDFEQELVRRLEAVAPGLSIRVRTLPELRTLSRRFALVPLLIGSIIAGFLLLMVVLGLLGVLWQNVVRRRPEIGLRRALGADAGAIHRQVLGELLLLVALGLGCGLVVVAQLPLFGVVEAVGLGVFAGAAVAAALLTVALTALAGWHPSRLATRIRPAEALHHE